MQKNPRSCCFQMAQLPTNLPKLPSAQVVGIKLVVNTYEYLGI